MYLTISKHAMHRCHQRGGTGNIEQELNMAEPFGTPVTMESLWKMPCGAVAIVVAGRSGDMVVVTVLTRDQAVEHLRKRGRLRKEFAERNRIGSRQQRLRLKQLKGIE